MGDFTVTPILAILLVVAAALVLVFLIMSVYFCLRTSSASRRVGRGPKGHAGQLSYRYDTGSHIPLQKGIDDCVGGSAGGGGGHDGSGMTTSLTTSTVTPSSSLLMRDVTMSTTKSADSINPDVIPVQMRTGESSLKVFFVTVVNFLPSDKYKGLFDVNMFFSAWRGSFACRLLIASRLSFKGRASSFLL